jgi:enoyl-CoA hydratase/carnithine racemase
MTTNSPRIDVPKSLSVASVQSLQHAIGQALQDDATIAVVLQGSEETFCRGLDLEEISAMGDPHLVASAAEEYCKCLVALRKADKPTVALVKGAVAGGGVGLVAACDLVIADEEASFALPEVLFGFAPGMVLPFLLERVPRQVVRLWALTAIKRSAAEAQTAGLVDRVVPSADLEGELRRWLKQFRRGHHRGVRTVKQLCREIPNTDMATGLTIGRQSTVQALREPEVVRGIARFVTDGTLPWEEQ